jgi:hypothetical protein
VKLLDAAEVKPGTGNWEQGWDGDPRGCGGVSVYISDPCDPDAGQDVIGSAADADGRNPASVDDCSYRVVPFGFVAEMVRSTRMSKDDDMDWLAGALKESSEIPVARGLLVQTGVAPRENTTWIGNDQATEIAAPALTDNNAVADAVAAGRSAFFAKTIGLRPILHVNPGRAITLKKAGVVELDPNNGDDRTAWGDPVVISEGYSDIPDLSPVPLAFWTGPLEITLGDVNREDVVKATRMNRTLLQVTRMAAIDTLPCAIVRIGAAPAPAGA